MIFPNLYADLSMFKSTYVGDATLDTADATDIERALETASRRVDEKARRIFYALTATRVLDGNGCHAMKIPDLLAATSIKLDEDGDRTFELTLASATDYYLKRHGAEDEDATPYTMLELDSVNGQRSSFLAQKRLVQIVGRWGYTEATESVGTAAEALDAGETALDVADSTLYSVGQTIKIDSEQMYVSAISTNTLTVDRGVNGTTDAAHLTAAPITRYVYTPEVQMAALMWAGRMWKRRETSYSNVIANPVVGSYEIFKLSDPDIEGLLQPHIRGDRLI